MTQLNVQSQEKIAWKNSLIVGKAYLDQLERSNALPAAKISNLRKAIENAETSKNAKKLKGQAKSLEQAAKRAKNAADSARLLGLASVLKEPEV